MIARGALALVAVLAVGSCAEDPTSPRLDTVMPASASHDATVTLSGRQLCAGTATADGGCAAAGGHVQLGLDPPVYQATVITFTDTVFQFQVPATAPPGPTSVVLTVNDRSSNALPFEVLP